MAGAGEAAGSWVPPALPEYGDAPPGSVLLDMRCYIVDLPNATTATGVTAAGLPTVTDALVPLPRAVAGAMPYHETGKTLAIGGARGTVAWVDLWRGAILCDVLADDERPAALRDVPLPVPARGNWDRLLREGDPGYVRDVAVGRRSKDSIKYVEMEIRPPRKVIPDSYLEWVRGGAGGSGGKVIPGGWNARTWSLPVTDGSWEDWSRECDVDVGDLTVDGAPAVSSGFLRRCLTLITCNSRKKNSNNLQGGDAKEMLGRLSVAYPTISMDDDAVYLFSNVGKLEVVVAVDVREKTLRGVAELDRQKSFMLMSAYCSSEISSYLKKTSE